MKRNKMDKYWKAAVAFLKWRMSWTMDAISKVFKNKCVIALLVTIVGSYIAGCFIADSNHRFDEDKRAKLEVDDSAIYFRIHSDVQGEKPDRTNLHFNFNLTAKRHAVNVYDVRAYYFDENLSKTGPVPHTMDNLQSGWEIIPDLENTQLPSLVKYNTFLDTRMKRCLVIIYYEDYKGFREPIKCYYKLNITEVDVYLFNWDRVPRYEYANKGLLQHLMDKDIMDGRNISWAEGAEISKSDDGKTINIFKGENSAEITIDEKEEKATLIVGDYVPIYLKVKTADGELNIYKGVSKGRIFEEHYNKPQNRRIGTYVGTSGWDGRIS